MNVANAVVGNIMNILPANSRCCHDNAKEFIYFLVVTLPVAKVP
jgi:hypothetical protein